MSVLICPSSFPDSWAMKRASRLVSTRVADNRRKHGRTNARLAIASITNAARLQTLPFPFPFSLIVLDAILFPLFAPNHTTRDYASTYTPTP